MQSATVKVSTDKLVKLIVTHFASFMQISEENIDITRYDLFEKKKKLLTI